jgi:hypothetical protein
MGSSATKVNVRIGIDQPLQLGYLNITRRLITPPIKTKKAVNFT